MTCLDVQAIFKLRSLHYSRNSSDDSYFIIQITSVTASFPFAADNRFFFRVNKQAAVMHVISPILFSHSVNSSCYEFIYTIKYIFASLGKSLTCRSNCPQV